MEMVEDNEIEHAEGGNTTWKYRQMTQQVEESICEWMAYMCNNLFKLVENLQIMCTSCPRPLAKNILKVSRKEGSLFI